MTTTSLEINAAGRLAHSLVAYTASTAGIRALSIKGPFASDFGLRDRRVSADADLLVDPTKLEALCARMEDRGWHPRAGRLPPTFIELHSVTLIHDEWPCDLDLHRFFPGFFSPPELVFELLWRGREVHRSRGYEVLTPSRAGMAAIVALHAARTPNLEKSRRDLESVRAAVASRFTPREIADFRQIVTEGRAQWVLRDLLSAIGHPFEDDASVSQKRLWSKNQQPASEKATSLWIREVWSAPLTRKPRVVLHALWVSRKDIPRNDPQRLPTWSEAWSFQRSRWARGARALSNYLRRVR